jgi:hypothetical protein
VVATVEEEEEPCRVCCMCQINKSSIPKSYSVKIEALCFLHQVLYNEKGVSLLAVVVVMSLSFSLSKRATRGASLY